jgi:hypothetical protein
MATWRRAARGGRRSQRGRHRFTALHAAVLRSDEALVRALLARGARPDAAMTKGTPMRRTSQDYDLPAALIPSTPFLLAARFLEPEIVRALKAGGANPRATMRDGTTAIMLAAGVGASATQDRRGVALIDGGARAREIWCAHGGNAAGGARCADAARIRAATPRCTPAAAWPRVAVAARGGGAQVDVKNGRGSRRSA